MLGLGGALRTHSGSILVSLPKFLVCLDMAMGSFFGSRGREARVLDLANESLPLLLGAEIGSKMEL